MKNSERWLLALCFGAGLGLTFGIVIGAIMDNVGMGISLGLPFGAGIGMVAGLILNASKKGD